MKYLHKIVVIETYEIEGPEGLGMSEVYERYVDNTVDGLPEPCEIEEIDISVELLLAAPDILEAIENLENDDNSIPAHAWSKITKAINKARGMK